MGIFLSLKKVLMDSPDLDRHTDQKNGQVWWQVQQYTKQKHGMKLGIVNSTGGEGEGHWRSNKNGLWVPRWSLSAGKAEWEATLEKSNQTRAEHVQRPQEMKGMVCYRNLDFFTMARTKSVCWWEQKGNEKGSGTKSWHVYLPFWGIEEPTGYSKYDRFLFTKWFQPNASKA